MCRAGDGAGQRKYRIPQEVVKSGSLCLRTRGSTLLPTPRVEDWGPTEVRVGGRVDPWGSCGGPSSRGPGSSGSGGPGETTAVLGGRFHSRDVRGGWGSDQRHSGSRVFLTPGRPRERNRPRDLPRVTRGAGRGPLNLPVRTRGEKKDGTVLRVHRTGRVQHLSGEVPDGRLSRVRWRGSPDKGVHL